jgi:uncharacterized protein YcbX
MEGEAVDAYAKSTPAPVGRVLAIRRYPVKSLLGEVVEEAALEQRGLAGDRRFALVTPAGKLASGKSTMRFVHVRGLFGLRAVYEGGPGGVPVVTLPDGTVVRGDDWDVDERLSAALGTPLRLAEEGGVSHLDDGPVHLCTTASLARLRELAPDSAVDERRFRPNLVVGTETGGFVEDRWIGRRVRVGEAELDVFGPTERCVMTTQQQEELPDDPRVLRAVNSGNERCLGVYAEVARPGVVRAGDPVTLLEP